MEELGQTCMLTVTQDKKETCKPWTHGYSAPIFRMHGEFQIWYNISP